MHLTNQPLGPKQLSEIGPYPSTSKKFETVDGTIDGSTNRIQPKHQNFWRVESVLAGTLNPKTPL